MDHKFINMEYLNSVSDGDPGIIREILNIFKEQTKEMYNEMVINLSQKNYPALGFLAHKAKSSVAIMGMDDLALMLKTFELQSKDGKSDHLYESYLERFKKETDEAVRELEGLLNDLPEKS